MIPTIDPFELKLPKKAKLNLRTERNLLKSPCGCWPPVAIRKNRTVVDGIQRVLVAKKYKYHGIRYTEIE